MQLQFGWAVGQSLTLSRSVNLRQKGVTAHPQATGAVEYMVLLKKRDSYCGDIELLPQRKASKRATALCAVRFRTARRNTESASPFGSLPSIKKPLSRIYSP